MERIWFNIFMYGKNITLKNEIQTLCDIKSSSECDSDNIRIDLFVVLCDIHCLNA